MRMGFSHTESFRCFSVAGRVDFGGRDKDYAEALAARRCWKHSRQKTGRP
jgi:hypothetical protein